MSVAIQGWWMYQTIRDSQYYYDIILLPAWSFMTIFFLNSCILNVVAIIVPGKWFARNSLYYSTYDASALELRANPQSQQLPRLLIQIPVYKESFAETIKPTLLNALEACAVYPGESSILVSDDGLAFMKEDDIERRQREEFYRIHSPIITYMSRPTWGRRGRFKKAGNVNYSLASSPVAQESDILLLLDSDSRISPQTIPLIVNEFKAEPRLGFIQVKTISMQPSEGQNSAWNTLISHFTDNIYSLSFVLVTAFGDPSPFVGHNAFLRLAALREVALEGKATTLFSEDHVSEDFECSMRLQNGGWIGRYVVLPPATEFEEGVTLNVFDEVIRLQKYAFGISELILNPISKWGTQSGILGDTFKKYLRSANVSLTTKYNIIGYMGTWYALAIIPFAVTIHYFGYFYCPYWHRLAVTSENIMYGCAIVFSALTPIATIILKWKLGRPVYIIGEITCTIIYGIFFSGIGIYLFISILGHAVGWPRLGWTATAKEKASKCDTLINGGRLMWPGIVFAFGQLGMVIFGWFYLGFKSWQGIFPMTWSAASTIAVVIMGVL